mmetsp:Transcript_9876/g.25383  ORF Transcript_9876/g.25383 Transcript_9876/m.25383 type:complete len:335 (+) Transcript_9876:159-1163(+)
MQRGSAAAAAAGGGGAPRRLPQVHQPEAAAAAERRRGRPHLRERQAEPADDGARVRGGGGGRRQDRDRGQHPGGGEPGARVRLLLAQRRAGARAGEEDLVLAHAAARGLLRAAGEAGLRAGPLRAHGPAPAQRRGLPLPHRGDGGDPRQARPRRADRRRRPPPRRPRRHHDDRAAAARVHPPRGGGHGRGRLAHVPDVPDEPRPDDEEGGHGVLPEGGGGGRELQEHAAVHGRRAGGADQAGGPTAQHADAERAPRGEAAQDRGGDDARVRAPGQPPGGVVHQGGAGGPVLPLHEPGRLHGAAKLPERRLHEGAEAQPAEQLGPAAGGDEARGL